MKPSNVKPIDPVGSKPAYYAPATSSTSLETIHVPGQVGVSLSGFVPADYESQIHLALLNLRKVLVASRLGVTDIAKLTLYIVNYDAKNRLHVRHIQKFLGSHRPAVTLVPVTQLAMPEWLFEIEAVMVRSSAATRESSLVSSGPGLGLTNAPSRLDADVIVVGAGLSGLIAARDVIRAGLSCVVLEARDRVGGKIFSQQFPNNDPGLIELGAAWINDTNQSRMIQLARDFGAELIEQNTSGNCVFQDFDGTCTPFLYGELPNFSPSVRTNVASIRDVFEAECQSLDSFNPRRGTYDSMTFEAYLTLKGATPTARATATIWTRAMLGQEPRDVSALYFLNYCKAGGGLLTMRSDRKGGGQHLRIRQGTQFFSKRLAESLPKNTVRLSNAVKAINQTSPDRVEVLTSTDTTIIGKKVILSLPTPCYSSIAFSPPLPEAKAMLISSTNYGYYAKLMLAFKTPFWTDRGYCGLAQSFTGPICVIRDTSIPPDNKWVLTCFLAGDIGRAWALIPIEADRIAALLKQIAQVFLEGDEKEAEKQYIQHLGSGWMEDEFSGWGCPCPSTAPGVLDAYGEEISTSVGNLHFVGTETAGIWKGYMEGAVRSGERGAAEVINELCGKTTAKL